MQNRSLKWINKEKSQNKIFMFPWFWGPSRILKCFLGLGHGGRQDFSRGETLQKNFKKLSKSFENIFKKFKHGTKIFWTFLKIFLRKMLIMHYFTIAFSQFNKAWGQVLGVWTKNIICRKSLRKFSQIFKNFLMKIAKNALI